MISQRGREMRKGRPPKMAKNVERLYKEGKCRDCSVLVTRMDFAKILGKFTKVKIQYESSSPKMKKSNETTGNSTARSKKSENGMVVHNNNANNITPNTPPLNTKKPKITKQVTLPSPCQGSNILKENNRLKKSPIIKDKNSNYNQQLFNSNLKQYGIIFINPNVMKTNDVKNKATLLELLPYINKSILPNEEWIIDYFPKSEEPKEDKVYDRIAAELEDLMYNEKTSTAEDKKDTSDNKVDEFPSIMDILNENTSESISKANDQSNTLGFKSNLESSDVEAMLLGKSSTISRETVTIPMDVDNTDMSTLIGEVPLDAIQDPGKNQESEKQENISQNCIANLGSPSIIDETLRKGIEEQLPCDNNIKNCLSGDIKNNDIATMEAATLKENDTLIPKTEVITHVIFKQTKNGKCYRCVTCPKNLKYSIELDGKAVEFIGAPKFISSLEDLEVLLQIVNESHLESLYVLH